MFHSTPQYELTLILQVLRFLRWAMLLCGLPLRLPRAKRRRRLRRRLKRQTRPKRARLVDLMARRNGCPSPTFPLPFLTPLFRPRLLAEVAAPRGVEGMLVAMPLMVLEPQLPTKPPPDKLVVPFPNRQSPRTAEGMNRTQPGPTLSLPNLDGRTALRLLPVQLTRAKVLTGAVVPRARTTRTLASRSTELNRTPVMPRALREIRSPLPPTRVTRTLTCPSTLRPDPVTVQRRTAALRMDPSRPTLPTTTNTGITTTTTTGNVVTLAPSEDVAVPTGVVEATRDMVARRIPTTPTPTCSTLSSTPNLLATSSQWLTPVESLCALLRCLTRVLCMVSIPSPLTSTPCTPPINQCPLAL